MSAGRTPPPRPSGQTMVGMGVIEGASARAIEREEPVTPPGGTDREALRRADVSLLLQEIHEVDERARGRADAIELQLQSMGGKVDAAISDLRELTAILRDRATKDATRDEALFSLLGLPEAMRKLEERQAITQAAVRALDTRVGYPPSTEDFARASAHDVTPEQLARLEQDHKLGTGIWRFVMSLHLRTSSSTRVAVGVGGGGGAVLGAVLSELLRLAF